MKKKLVIAIFLTLVISSISVIPASTAQSEIDITGKTATGEPLAVENVVTILKGVDGEGISREIVTIDDSVKQNLIEQIMEFKTWIEQARPFQDIILTEEEKIEIIEKVNPLLDSINLMLEESNLNPIEPTWLYNEMFNKELGRSIVISVGKGYAFIPWYHYESFYGVLFRPLWLLYPPWFMLGGGYTGNLNINVFPPRIEYGDRLGSHIVRTTFFSGLYLNLGDLGYDNLFSGPMLLLGRARVVMSGDF
jgi:hypothetical protein